MLTGNVIAIIAGGVICSTVSFFTSTPVYNIHLYSSALLNRNSLIWIKLVKLILLLAKAQRLDQ